MAVERAAGGTSLIDVLDRVLDKGIVIDAWVRVSLVGIDLITVEARVVVASIDTYLKYSEAVGQVGPGLAAGDRGQGRMTKLVAENAALRAQLQTGGARPPHSWRSARAGARLSANGRRRTPACRACASQSKPPTAWRRRRVTAARLRLLEGFVSRTEIADCAQVALHWLGEVRGVPQSICLVRPVGEQALFVVGAYGLPRAPAVASFTVSLDDWTNPLVRRSRTGGRSFFPAAALGRRSPPPPVDAVRDARVPRRAARRRERSPTSRSGCCCSAADGAAAHPTCTGSSPSSARSSIRSSAAGARRGDRKQRRERTLLFTIINAVTDPILLTDTEGRLIVANARALTLFAASEEESEGRRRAVG